MNILAFNGSPRMKKGQTDLFLQHFIKGAKEAGAETETVYLANQNIKYCSGCFNCWFVHPGKCIHNDDMPEIRTKIRKADIVVLASPIYIDGFTAQTKTMLDRLIAGGSPFIESRDGHSRHPSRGKELKTRKLLLLSTCGFGEIDNFNPMIHHAKAIANNLATFEWMGAIVRPMGGAVGMIQEEEPDKVNTIFEAFRQSGYDAVSKGTISEEIQKAASMPVMTIKEFADRANKMFTEMIKSKG